MKRLLIISGILVLIIALVLVFSKGDGKTEIRVVIEKVTKRNITEQVSASGKVQPEEEVKIMSDVSGQIVELLVKEGDTVKKGQLLLRINPNVYQSASERMTAMLNGAQANLANSKARQTQAEAQFTNNQSIFNRNKKLHDQGAISDAEFEASRAQYESSKAEVEAARESVRSSEFNVSSNAASLKEANENLSRTSIYAPVDGTVSKLSKRKGESVLGNAQMAGEVVLTLANLMDMQVEVDVNENDILRVHLYDTALVEVEAHDNRKFKGIVIEVANSAKNASLSTDQVTNFLVKIRILHESYSDLLDSKHPERYPFLPGMSATVDIQTRSVKQVVSVSVKTVTTRTDTTAKAGEKSRGDEKQIDDETSPPDMKSGDTREDESINKEPVECVFVLNGNTVRLVPVKTGVQDNQFIEIISGLKPDDEVVSDPSSAVRTRLYQGAKVKKVTKEVLMLEED